MITTVWSCLFTYVYSCLLVFTFVYSCLPKFATVYSCMFTYVYPRLHVFTYVYICLPMFTLVYLYLPLFTRVYLCLLVFTYVYHCLIVHVHLCLHSFTYVYPFVLKFTYVYLCLLVFTYNYTCLLVFTPVYQCLCILICVYLCLLMFAYVYWCLPMFTSVYLCLVLFTRACLTMFTNVYSCLPMFTLLLQWLWFLLVLLTTWLLPQCPVTQNWIVVWAVGLYWVWCPPLHWEALVTYLLGTTDLLIPTFVVKLTHAGLPWLLLLLGTAVAANSHFKDIGFSGFVPPPTRGYRSCMPTQGEYGTGPHSGPTHCCGSGWAAGHGGCWIVPQTWSHCKSLSPCSDQLRGSPDIFAECSTLPHWQ